MKKITTIATSALLLFVSILGLNGCSSSSTPSTTSTVTMTAETDGTKATSAFHKNPNSPTAGIVADSIEVTRVRFLLSAVKLHVGTDQVRGDIGQRRLTGEFPEIGVAVHQRAEPAHMGIFRCVGGAKVEDVVGRGEGFAGFQKFGGQVAQTPKPGGRDQPVGC